MRFRTGNEPEEPRESRKRLLSESEHDSHRHTRMQSEATGSRREFEPQKTSSLSRTRPSVRESKDAVRSSSRVRDRDRDYTRSRRSKDPEQCRSGVGHGIDRSQPCREESPHRSVKSLISTVFHWRRGSQGQDLERVLQAQNNGMKALISRLHAENWKLHDGVRALEDDVCKYQKNHEDAMREAAEHYNRQCAAYEAEKQHTIRQINQLAHTRESLEKALMQKTTLLETRTNELRTAETFLSKYDEIPGDEVVSLVSELNQLVLGIAEKCCDLFSFGKTTPGREKSSDEVEITNQLKSMVGSPLVDFLLSKDHNEDPTIVQLAIQAFLIIGLYDFLKYWPIPPHAGDFRSNYTKLYENIHEKEMQAVAARWRALGSKHLRLGFGIELRHVVSESEQWLKAILQIAGVQASESNTEQLKGDLERLWNLPFEERIAKSQGHGDVKGTSPVLCSTELGLMRVTNIGTPGGAPHKLEEQVISKATVIFEHEIAQMFA
ncbi:hypothetical protein EW145_g4480 [Phellinidium pouzarii]|uniref:Uncharacterized protein n=1 Tax=Phellinidium pouzarii TaxID=167371 RepID=A0A4S4L893_9AGAM|nr:hypothetical protein EW145_g4480 [Phellinidium pouzarii]